MAASTITVQPSPVEIARGAAAAIPSEVSTRPLLGILGVVLGAGLVTLTGRMLTLGLADLKGHVGISFDDGAWLDSAFNASLMFIGPSPSISAVCSVRVASCSARRLSSRRHAPFFR